MGSCQFQYLNFARRAKKPHGCLDSPLRSVAVVVMKDATQNIGFSLNWWTEEMPNRLKSGRRQNEQTTLVLADLHIRSEIGAMVTCSGQFAGSETFHRNPLYDGQDRRCPCDGSNVQR
jgi:hypothetical protein